MQEENFLAELPIIPKPVDTTRTEPPNTRVCARIGESRYEKVRRMVVRLKEEVDTRYTATDVVKALIDAAPEDVNFIFPND